MAKATKQEIAIILKAHDQASKEIDAVSKKVKQAGSAAEQAGGRWKTTSYRVLQAGFAFRNLGGVLPGPIGRIGTLTGNVIQLSSSLMRAANMSMFTAGHIGALIGGVGMLTNVLGSVVRAMRTVALYGGIAMGVLSALAAYTLKLSGDVEQAAITFGTLYRSMDAAREMIEYITIFAAKTPFELPELIEAGKNLAAFGLDVKQYLPLAGDLAAAFGATREHLMMVISAFGRIKAGQFGEAFEVLRRFGIGTRELTEKGGIKFQQGRSIPIVTDPREVLEGVGKVISTTFPGLMEKMSATLLGKWSNLWDGIKRIAISVGDSMRPFFTDLLGWIADSLDKFLLSDEFKQFQGLLMTLFSEETLAKAKRGMTKIAAFALVMQETLIGVVDDITYFFEHRFLPPGSLSGAIDELLKFGDVVSRIMVVLSRLGAVIYGVVAVAMLLGGQPWAAIKPALMAGVSLAAGKPAAELRDWIAEQRTAIELSKRWAAEVRTGRTTPEQVAEMAAPGKEQMAALYETLASRKEARAKLIGVEGPVSAEYMRDVNAATAAIKAVETDIEYLRREIGAMEAGVARVQMEQEAARQGRVLPGTPEGPSFTERVAAKEVALNTPAKEVGSNISALVDNTMELKRLNDTVADKGELQLTELILQGALD